MGRPMASKKTQISFGYGNQQQDTVEATGPRWRRRALRPDEMDLEPAPIPLAQLPIGEATQPALLGVSAVIQPEDLNAAPQSPSQRPAHLPERWDV